ncbi:hypothetical protein H632_c935p0 [Helicosporidium sp. ATCC 50920]|nr:hypothetical protein H632_c935p0 [Helicosporidium sp. ATCC 50920]|eukprot:KDD74998.1 hypothetical protein H632_c935p0 [Helicosporidium sp. ATCC 50920]
MANIMTLFSARVRRFYVWGSNVDGALATTSRVGNDILTPRPSDVDPVAPIDGGIDFACQMRDAVYCWGSNGSGRLGRGDSFTDVYSAEPAAVAGLSGTPLSMGVGSTHVCVVIDSEGTVAGHCWGANASGQLGNGTIVDAASPVQVTDPSSGAYAKIYAGQTHSCALTNAGAMWCWGSNAWGQLAQDASTASTATPSAITPPADEPDTVWALAATGARNTCGGADSGAIFCWGAADLGVNGNGDLENDQYSPVLSFNMGPLSQLYLKTNTVIMVLVQGGITGGWGDNSYGQLATDPEETPIVEGARSVVQGTRMAAVGDGFLCAQVVIGPEAVLACLGDNAHGQLGDGTRASASNFVVVASASDQHWNSIYAGYNASYGRQGNPPPPYPAPPPDEPDAPDTPSNLLSPDAPPGPGSAMLAWGSNASGALASTEDLDTNVTTPRFVSLDASPVYGGQDFACQISGGVVCWGSNQAGKLGRGSTFVDSYSATPAAVVDLEGDVYRLGVGSGHACAIMVTTEKLAFCWGSNDLGQLGNNSQTASGTPVQAALPAESDLSRIYAGFKHTCALLSPGAMFCWGSNAEGQLAQPAGTSSSSAPLEVPLPDDNPYARWAVAATGLRNTCVSERWGDIYCWGAAATGINGNSDLVNNVYAPFKVGSYAQARYMSMTGSTIHVLLTTGLTYIWGDNQFGQAASTDTVAVRMTPATWAAVNAKCVATTATASYLLIAHGGAVYYSGVGGNEHGQLGNGVVNTSNFNSVEVQPESGYSWECLYGGYDAVYGMQLAAVVSPDSPAEDASPDSPAEDASPDSPAEGVSPDSPAEELSPESPADARR